MTHRITRALARAATGALLSLLVGGTQALAGTGPWILGPGDAQLYLGADAQWFRTLAIDSGSFADDVIGVDQGVSLFGARAIAAFGLAPRVEVEVEVPYHLGFGHEVGDVCTLLGLDACATTHSLGVVVGRGKVLVLDPVAGAPLALSVGLDLRFGQATARFRERITAGGEGTFDVEPRVSVGHTGALGTGWWSVSGDLAFRYRVPLDRDVGGTGVRAPGFELLASTEALFSPRPVVAFGPVAGVLGRPVGMDFSGAVLEDQDRLSALRVLTLEAGAKVILRSSRNVSVSASALRVVYAVNNPSDTWKVGFGVAIRELFRRRGV